MPSRALQLTVLLCCVFLGVAEVAEKKHHKHHHKHHHKPHEKLQAKVVKQANGKHAAEPTATQLATGVHAAVSVSVAEKDPKHEKKNVLGKQTSKEGKPANEKDIAKKLKTLESELERKQKNMGAATEGRIEINGPLPADFAERFAQSVAQATGCDPAEVKVIDAKPVVLLQAATSPVLEVVFRAPADVVKAVENQAADPDSKLANGPLRSFLVAKDGGPEETPVKEKGIDVDTEMPYGELEPFGREDTAQELTEQSVRESDEMVDQLERAEVAEEKRSTFRALTRLRGAAITSYDGIARAQTGSIDEYNKTHKWRKTHPLHHLADEESDISKWAFPDNADF